MSISRRVISSPFDIPQQRRTPKNPTRIRTSYNGCKVRNRNSSNIMADTRVVRRSIFNNSTQNNTGKGGFGTKYTTFDRRLVDYNSMFANPIVKVTGGKDASASERKKKVTPTSTPPPVKGRHHVCIQTDGKSIDKFFYDELSTFPELDEKHFFLSSEGDTRRKEQGTKWS